jgi:hypothetical protein
VFHDEGGVQALDVGEGGQVVVFEALVGAEVGGDDAEEVVGVAEEALGLDYLGDAGYSFLEAEEGVSVFLAHGDEDQCRQTVGAEHGG